jgi:O-antigen/teichoic acid export membrane protein
MFNRLSALLRRPLVSDALWLYAVQGLNYLLPLLLLPYLLRVLTPEAYGAVMLAQSLVGYGAILVDFGFNFTAARDIAAHRQDPAAILRVYWTTVVAKLALFAVASVALSLVVLLVPGLRLRWELFAVSGLLLVGNLAFPVWYLQGMSRLKDVALVQALSKVIVAVLVVTAVHSADDLVLAAAILASPQLLGAIGARLAGCALAPAGAYWPDATEVRAALASSRHMFASIASTTLYLHTNTLVLGFVAGDRAVGFYSLATRLASALQSLVTPVVQSAFPRAGALFATDPVAAWNRVLDAARWILPAVAAGSLLLALFAEPLVSLVGGPDYRDAVVIVRIVALLPVCVAAATLVSQLAMVNLEMTAPLFRIYVAVGLLNLLLIVPLTLWGDARGAAVALVIAEFIGPVLMYRAVRRRLPALRASGC